MKTLAPVLAFLCVTSGLWAQGRPLREPWRGAGPEPCLGSDGGVIKCAQPDEITAVRAGRLFDSVTGQLRTKQVILIDGEKITAVGPEGQIKPPVGARVIDLSFATVRPV